MAETFRVSVSKKIFDRKKMPVVSRHVLVEIFDWDKELTTKAGVVIGFNPDVLYAEGSGSHIADVARIYGQIVWQPEALYFHHKKNFSPPWRANLETQVGDFVWFHPLISVNCEELLVEGRLFKVIPYDDLFVARRGGMDGEVIPLNGYCIMSISKKEKTSSFDVISEMAVNYDRGVVKHVGRPNIKYQSKNVCDHQDIRVGDEVIFDSRIPPAYLERNEFNLNFDGENQYFVMQRQFISMVVNR